MRFIPIAFIVVLIETCFGVEVNRPAPNPSEVPTDTDLTDGPGEDPDANPGDEPTNPGDEPTDPVAPRDCAPAGCSGQLCAPVGTDLFTTCEYLPEYACFAETTCGPFGPDGSCAWDLNDAWQDCMDNLGGDALDDDAPMPGTPLTVEEILADASGFEGARITACGVLQPSAATCTQMACSPANPCCNSCGASLSLEGSIILSGEGVGCAGDDCSLTCAPEPPSDPSAVSCFEGVFTQEPFAGPTLTIDP